jgi:uncharacterized peroxidase-related enzyme
MSIITTITEEEASGDVAAIYADDRETFGYVTEHTKLMALNPAANQAFEDLTRAVQPSIGTRNYRLITLAAARALESQPCLLAHGTFARKLFDDEQLIGVATDHHAAGLTDAEVAMMDFAVKVCQDSAGMTDADSQVLRDHGFTDRQIVDITLAAAARNFYSRALSALAIVDRVPAEQLPAEVRDALLADVRDSARS